MADSQDDSAQAPTFTVHTGVPSRFRATMPGVLIIQTDIYVDEEDYEDIFVLRSAEPEYEARHSSKTDNVAEEGFVRLRFEGVPKRSMFTLSVESADGNETTLFENVPFREIHRLTRPGGGG